MGTPSGFEHETKSNWSQTIVKTPHLYTQERTRVERTTAAKSCKEGGDVVIELTTIKVSDFKRGFAECIFLRPKTKTHTSIFTQSDLL